MSRWSNILLDVSKMKEYAKSTAQLVTLDIAKYRETDELRMKDAAMARFQLDRLLLDEGSLNAKWCQFMVHSFTDNQVVFRGTEKECIDYMNKNKSLTKINELELYWALPDEQHWSWNRYFREVEKRCNIGIEFWL